MPRLFDALGVRCIANCRSERDKLIRHGYKPHHVGYLYNLCELENVTLPQTNLREQLRIPPRAVVIGSLSRLAKDRGVNYAIDYFCRLVSEWRDTRPIYLLIGGDGPERNDLEGMARTRIASERIRFLGVVTSVVEFYSSLDVFWNTPAIRGDEGAGTGNTTIEAAFCRVPVVSHAAAGIGELIEHHITGALLQVGDGQGFIENTLALLSDKEYSDMITGQALQRVRALCGKEQYIQRLETYYRDL